jgi:hypothetical protein
MKVYFSHQQSIESAYILSVLFISHTFDVVMPEVSLRV